MDPGATIIIRHEVQAGKETFLVLLGEEDLSGTYPGMARYTIEAMGRGEVLARMRTNSYEYAPDVPIEARGVAGEIAGRWARELSDDPESFIRSSDIPEGIPARIREHRVAIIQGSPRPGGNCAILASWAADAAREEGWESTVLFPDDMDIHTCIGCYQCYNTGSCVFRDDMTAVIESVATSSLVVVCSPVYTNTVPAGLKALLDRFQALHAERTLGGTSHPCSGVLLGVSGRKGRENFRCMSSVISAFFALANITPMPPLLIDGTDEIRNVRLVPGLRGQVDQRIRGGLRGEW